MEKKIKMSFISLMSGSSLAYFLFPLFTKNSSDNYIISPNFLILAVLLTLVHLTNC